MTGTRLVIVYVVVGLAVGLAAARVEYREGTAPSSLLSAGIVGLGAAMFWPILLLALLFGLAAMLGERMWPRR